MKELILFLILLVLIAILYNSASVISEPKHQPVSQPQIIITNPSRGIIPAIPSGPPQDPFREFDIRTLADPLTEPTRRQPRYLYGPLTPENPILNPLFNHSTHGYTDSYSWIAYLIDESTDANKDDNKILKLFGRQKYPSSSQYEYYVEVKSGGDRIKYFLENIKKELFDGDTVTVDLIKRTYTVKLMKNRDLTYNPFI